MKNKKLIYIIFAIVVVLIIVIVIIKTIKKKNIAKYKLTDEDVNANEWQRPPATKPDDNDSFPLEMGSRGNNVKQLQIMLNATAFDKMPEFSKLKEDGIYGTKTSSAVDILMENVRGHIKGKVTWAEFLALKKIYEKK